MNDDEPTIGSAYRVVVNGRGQYSIWPADAPLPCGWAEAGLAGDLGRCLEHVGEVWTELRPRPAALSTMPP